MNKIKTLSVALTWSLLFACGDSSDQEAIVEAEEKQKIATPIDGYIKAIDKTKDAEKKILEAAEKQRKMIDGLDTDKNSSGDDG